MEGGPGGAACALAVEEEEEDDEEEVKLVESTVARPAARSITASKVMARWASSPLGSEP